MHQRDNPAVSRRSPQGVSPESALPENTPKIPPQRPRLQANTYGRTRLQADWRGSTSVIEISDLGKIRTYTDTSEPMRTQNLVAEERCHRYPRTVDGSDAIQLIQAYMADLGRFETRKRDRK